MQKSDSNKDNGPGGAGRSLDLMKCIFEEPTATTVRTASDRALSCSVLLAPTLPRITAG